MTTKHDITADLETLIDKHGLLNVLTGLEFVCGEKAEHIRANWQDRALARAWDQAATVCGAAARAYQSSLHDYAVRRGLAEVPNSDRG